VIDTLRDRKLTRKQIANKSDLSNLTLRESLRELQDYGIIRMADEKEWNGRLQYQVHNAGNIEALRKDVYSDPDVAPTETPEQGQ